MGSCLLYGILAAVLRFLVDGCATMAFALPVASADEWKNAGAGPLRWEVYQSIGGFNLYFDNQIVPLPVHEV